MTLHCMVDLETLGVRSDAAVIQIGWCLFNEDTIIKHDKATINFEDALKHGSVSASKLIWWLQQSDEARKSILNQDHNGSLGAALNKFKVSLDDRWGRKVENGQYPGEFWAHATFDFPILNNAFSSTNIPNPIDYWRCRDIRTLELLAGKIPNKPIREGIHHDAEDDAIYQAKYVQLMLNKLRNK